MKPNELHLVRVRINWEDEEAMKRAARTKERLENEGYRLLSTIRGTRRATLIYTNDKPKDEK